LELTQGSEFVANKRFTLMIVPEAVHGQVRRWQIPRKTLWALGLTGMLALSGLIAMVVHYSYVVDQVYAARSLREDNAKLRERLDQMNHKVEDVDGKLAHLRRFDEQLRVLSDLPESAAVVDFGGRSIAAGGAGGGNAGALAVALPGRDQAAAELRDALLDSRLQGLAAEASRQLTSLAELVDHLQQREMVLRSTPSIAPARGLLTSGFGPRSDPFTGTYTMHSGLDIAAPEGAEIFAPADATVAFADEKGEYGNCVVLEHGRGVQTLFGHLKKFIVKAGESVKRGQLIGYMGSTGRSTAPHLHYEVRRDGTPINPRPYIH
jgi:murein DD-endopeptidase MepM/ murein hydrolase activator NlpD